MHTRFGGDQSSGVRLAPANLTLLCRFLLYKYQPYNEINVLLNGNRPLTPSPNLFQYYVLELVVVEKLFIVLVKTPI